MFTNSTQQLYSSGPLTEDVIGVLLCFDVLGVRFLVTRMSRMRKIEVKTTENSVSNTSNFFVFLEVTIFIHHNSLNRKVPIFHF